MKIKRIIFIFMLMLLGVLSLWAQSSEGNYLVRINQVISKNFPSMTVYVSIINKKDNTPVPDLEKSNFKVFVDSKDITKIDEKDTFANAEEAASYYIVMDTSEWLGDTLPHTRKGIQLLIDEMDKDKDHITLYAYEDNHRTIFEYARKDAKFPNPQNPNEEIGLMEKVNEVGVVEGVSSRLYDKFIHFSRRINALETEENLDLTKRKVMFLISDASTDNDVNSETQFYDAVANFPYPIYSIGFVIFDNHLDVMEDLSERTGGYYIYARKYANIPDIMKTMQNIIEKTYILKFKVPKNVLIGDGENHELNISVDSQGNKAYSYKNFKAPPPPPPIWLYILIGALALLIIVALVIIFIIIRKKTRASMGITKRKCPECKKRMKDDWDECMFCKYIPKKKKKVKGE